MKKQNRWLYRFNNMSLAKKMMMVYVIIFGTLCGITLVALQVTLNIYDNQLYQKSLEELNFFTDKVDGELKKVEELSYDLAMDYDIQNQLSVVKDAKNRADYSFQMSKLRSRLTTEAVSSELVTEFIYTDKFLTRYEVGNSEVGQRHVELPVEIFDRMLDKFDKARGGYIYENPTIDFPYLVSGRDIRKHLDYSLDYLGSLIFVSDIQVLIGKHMDKLKTDVSSLCVYSEDGIVYQSEDGLYDRIKNVLPDEDYEIINISGRKYFLCKLMSPETGWTYINMFPYSSIYSMNSIVRIGIIGGFIFLFFLAMLVMKQISKAMTKPLEKLTDSIQIVESGDFKKARDYLENYVGGDERTDEAGILTQEFMVMLDKITFLIHENYEKQILLKDTQYRALQAQINPHFLYNTLNSINWIIKAGKNEEASEMLISLGELLRAAFRKEQLATVEEELELVRHYIDIQKVRYRSRAEFIIEAVGDLKEYYVPRMILQPIVENAIHHGVDNSLNKCRICVKVEELKEEEKIVLEVMDDGPGMTEEELVAVQTFTMIPKGNGIGLKNIQERLQLIFQDSVFEISSLAGKGTVVRVEIPKYRGE
jgi:two-component system sensor histidine kinase YesM